MPRFFKRVRFKIVGYSSESIFIFVVDICCLKITDMDDFIVLIKQTEIRSFYKLDTSICFLYNSIMKIDFEIIIKREIYKRKK